MKVALVDPGSFVLPYDYYLAAALVRAGHSVDFYGSETLFNQEFLAALRQLPNVNVVTMPISSSVAGRVKGTAAYIGLLTTLLRRRHQYEFINLQFSLIWPIETALFTLLRKRFVYTVHNAIPHDSSEWKHRPVELLSSIAREIWFPSSLTEEEFTRRYGFKGNKTRLVQHGTMGATPGLPPVPYRAPPKFEGLAYWSNIKPYKGVELMLELGLNRNINSPSDVIEVHGCWSSKLYPLRDEMRSVGILVEDRFLSPTELSTLLERDLIFLLPYRSASQSGALYTLLHHGRLFCATDVGDLGRFLRKYGLDGLILREPTADAVAECINWLNAHLDVAIERFSCAQSELSWDQSLTQAELVDPLFRRSQSR